MANVSYDTLTITINADSKQANASISRISNNLEKLNNTAKNIDKEKIEEMKTLLVDIASIDFSNVSKGLQDIVSAFKSFQSKNFVKGVSGLSGTRQSKAPMYAGTQLPDFSAFPQGNIDAFTKSMEELLRPTQIIQNSMDKFSQSVMGLPVERINNLYTETERIAENLYNMGLNGNQVNVILGAIDKHLGEMSSAQLEQVRQILENAGLSAKEIENTLKRLNQEMNNTEKGGKKASGGLSQLALQFKNILKYRVVRKVIQTIFAEISNAMTELAYVDKDFDQALGEIKSAMNYIGRVLVSVIAPIIKVIAPIITMVAEAIGSIVSGLGSALAGALGQDEFAEAQENVESYTDSLKKAKSVATGIDKLNIISNDKNEGNFKMTDATKMSGELGNLFNKISERLKPLLQELIPQIANILVSVIKAVERIAPLLTLIVDLVADFVSMTDDSVNGSIATFVDMIGGVLGDLGTILQTLKPILDIVNMINAVVLNLTNDGIGLIANIIQSLFGFITAIFETLVAVINGDFDKIDELWDKLLDRLGDAWSHWFESICRGFYKGFQKIGKLLGYDLPDMPSTTINSYATGGFPKEDGIFFANHNELVGQFSNGKTAVANNQQITQGIYQAVLQAMRESGSGNISVQLDGQEVAKIITKRQNNFGSDLVIGGNINYGKRL